jgi:hypothetical protein
VKESSSSRRPARTPSATWSCVNAPRRGQRR